MKPRILSSWTRNVPVLILFMSLFLADDTRAQSEPGSALLIVGTINYVAVPHAVAFNSLPITVMAWVNTTVTTGQQGLVNKYAAGSLNGWNIFLLNGRVRAWYFVSGSRNVFGGGDGMDGGFIADGRWHHIALIVDSSGAVMLVDGVPRASQTWTGTPGATTTTQEMRIGSYPGGNNGFVGSIFIDDVSVWNTTLSFDQIRISRAGGLTGLEASRLAFYRCDEGSGMTVGDSAPLGGNNNGTWVGLELFQPVVPSVQTLPASAIDFTRAALNGIAQPNRSAISAGFEWGTTTNFGNTNVVITFGGPGASVEQNHSLVLTNLPPATTFHFRAFASNSTTVVRGINRSFRTFGLFAETLPATDLSATSATLNGVANPGGENTIAWFEFGTTTNLGNVTPIQSLGAGVLNTNFSHVLTLFTTIDTFHFRAVASNSFGLVPGAIRSFSLSPSVATLPASDIGLTNATLNGAASANGLEMTAWFEWGLTPSYGNVTPPQALGSDGNVTNYNETLTNLFPFGTFHYRAVGSNSLGMLLGTNQIFQTPSSTTDKVLFGTVTVSIQPSNAVADGASWILDSGAFQVPGLPRTSVPPGPHTVLFRDLANWREPLPVDVFVVGGRTSEVSVVFVPLPVFDFNSIPEQHARHGEALEFFVTNLPPAGQVQVTGVPPPAGSLTFDPVTGRVTYVPAPTDRLPFALNVSTGGVQIATTVITPLPDIPLEDVVIAYDRPLPDDESRDYITISEVLNEAEVFNNFTNQTLTVEISGKTLVFDTTHPAKLHSQYNGRENIKEFRLYADRVIIRSPLLLPQTHVTIHARELRFEGGGLIDTTPKSLWTAPRAVVWEDDNVIGFPGSPGHNGGDADIFVERFHADPTPAIRFILNGGNGGPPGEGRNGVFEGNAVEPIFFPGELGTGVDEATARAITNWNRLMVRAGNPTHCGISINRLRFYSETLFNGVLNPNFTCGDETTVARGEPAVPSGIPGGGGRGGNVRSTVDLSAYVSQVGGTAGTNGGNYVGGTLVYQYVYEHISHITVGPNPGTTVSYTQAPKVPGADATAPTGANGVPGSVVVIPDPAAWLHSFAVRGVVRFVRDAYLNERTTEARALLADYRDFIRTLQPQVDSDSVTNLNDAEFAETVNLDQLGLEIDTLIHRIDSNLDFFGNPAGWVPMLSFEANLTAFEQEVDQSIPILYLAYWLNNAATNVENSLSASGVAVVKLKDELEDMVAAFHQAQLLIPTLKTDSDILGNRIAGLKARLLVLEQELLARAQNNLEERNKVPFWKKALGALSVAADLVPIGQPTVGRIGAGLSLLTKLDASEPLASLQANKTNVFAIMENKNIGLCFTNSVPATNSTPEQIAAAKKKKLKLDSNCAKFLGAELEELAAVFKEVQVDSKALAAELEKIKASDPVFLEVTAELKQLNADKERLAQKLAAAVQAVSTLAGAITENSLATHQLEQRVAQAITALDHNALLHVKEMEQRAKDRLLKFQYFVAKAFQYRLLQPYGGNLQLTRIFDRFQVLVETGNSHVLTEDEFLNLKALYVDELRDIVAQTLAPLNANAPERSQPASFSLVPEELEQLNRDGRLVINLRDKGFFASAKENIRIVDLRASQLDVRPTGPFGGFALCFVDFEHQGVSRLTRGGQSFLFRHYQTEAVNPITWNALFDGIANTVTHSVPSPASESLIRTLIDQPDDDTLLLFSRPAADADILITKTVSTGNGTDLVIDALSIQVQYEFFNTSSTRHELTVKVIDDLEPIIAVSQTDLNGRRDGQGDFLRVYSAGTPVTLQAPAAYGGRTFDRWLVNQQPRAAGLTTLALTVSVPLTVEASFAAAPLTAVPPFITQHPQDVTAVVGNTATFTVAVTGTDPLAFRWQTNNTPMSDGGRIAGAATATLVITNVGLADAAAYSVVISNAFGVRTSQDALLTVTGPGLFLLPAGTDAVGFQFPTVVGFNYIIERKFRMEDPEWELVEVIAGTGGLRQFTRPTVADSSFFRLRVE